MQKHWKLVGLLTLVMLAFVVSCTGGGGGSTATPTAQAGLANPASTYCVDHGNKLEMRTASDGGQYGVCIFPDGSECEEWAYFRGTCAPGTPAPATP